MQQAYPQLGIKPVESGCVGLTISQVQQLDWDKIDMTEYIESAVVAGKSRMNTQHSQRVL